MFSIWEKETFFAHQDVIIIGSGFAGLWSALYLQKKHPSAKVTILDRGLIPAGASTRNAGFACFGSLSELVFDAATMGVDKTLALVEMRYRGLRKIQKQFGHGAIDFDLCGGYELFHGTAATAEKLEADIRYLNSLLRSITGTRQTYKLADEKIPRFGFAGIRHMVRNNDEGALHSGKLVQALLRHVQAAGVQVLNNVEVKGFAQGNGHLLLHTAQGISFTAGRLLICTNAVARDLLPEADIIPARGQVLLTSPIRGLSWNGTFHFDEGFYYFRNLGNRVLLGGARNKAFDAERTQQVETSATIQQELERFLGEVVLPAHRGQYSIENRWAGIMGMGSEKMPVVQSVGPGVFCALGTGGMGVALAPVIGRQAADLVL